ncbi:hypothetical protein ACVGXS_00335, partial [Enterobacter hormaechei]
MEMGFFFFIRNFWGFSKPPLRDIFNMSNLNILVFFFFYNHQKGGKDTPRLGFDNWRQPVGQTESIANRLPAGRAKRVNPP